MEPETGPKTGKDDMEKNEMPQGLKSHLTSRQAKYGLNTLIYSLVALAIVVAVNLIAKQFVRQLDLTANQRYSLSQQTANILSGLDRDVELLYFDRRANFGNLRDLLEQYSVLSRRVKVSYVDPDQEPGKANQYNVKTYGTVILAAGDRNEQAKGVEEGDITNTLIRLLKGEAKLIYFLEGHGERDLESNERLGLSEAKTALEESNYQVQTVSLLEESPQVPEDASVLVVAGPQNDLLEPEIDAIREYIQGGGRAFFLVNPHTPPNLTALLAEFGADVQNTLVVDTSGIGRLFGTDELMPLVMQYEDHPITKDLANVATLFPFACAVQSSSDAMPGAQFQLIARTTANSWATTQVRATEVSFREGVDLEGPLALMGAGTYKPLASENGEEGRIVVAGSTDMVANSILGFNGNRDLFLNAMSWLASDEDLISIRPRDPEDRRVDLSSSQMDFVWLCMFAVPLAIVLGGFGVWWKRRG
ncbi:MAG: GldG family protein [Acidobacteria bacterium]|nr:GldG family protein [Acidobacteriota bacterium]